ncbi:MAG: hypothetical protein ABI698_02855 [bacterium]
MRRIAYPADLQAVTTSAVRGETKDQQRNYFAAYRNHQPEAVFGQTIYLYRVK